MLSRTSPEQAAAPGQGGPLGLLHQLFERQAALAPHALAIHCDTVRITYGELERRSNSLARELTGFGVKPGSRVAILLPRGPTPYHVLLAVLKSGGAYVPLEPDFPAERIGFILADCGAPILITTATLATKATDFEGRVVLIHENHAERPTEATEPESPLRPGTMPEDVCYVIYTSGTTGRPKGVEIEHRSAYHLVQTEGKLFGILPQDRVFQGFSLAFDASVEEVWLAFANGATLVVGTTELLRSGPALSDWLAGAGVTVLSCVPTLLAMMDGDIPSLRLLILGGEVCPAELVKRWWKPDRRLVNTYGPTEATVIATWADCHPQKPITIGRPLPGYVALVLNEQLQLAGPDEAGELVLGGLGLARGYLQRPELTAEKFILRSFDGGPVQRLYRTGDRVRWTNQELEFLGRIDTQVKIRGFRVELAEIESVLLECSEIKIAAVVLRQDQPGVDRLLAYVVPRAGSKFEPSAIQALLKTRLPAYMIPSSITVLSSLPTLSSGKVDRQALLSVPFSMPETTREVIEPQTPMEEVLVQTWAKLFSVSAVGVDDDFFLDLGGHSLLAARMVSELRRVPKFESLSMADVYSFPTVARLAKQLENSARINSEAIRVERLERQTSFQPGEVAGSSRSPAGQVDQPSTGQAIPFLRHFLCGAAQLVSLVFVLSFFALQWLAPYLTYTVLIEEEYEFVTAILVAFASLALLYPVMLLVAIATKWIVIGRYKPGVYPLWGWYYFRFWLVTSIEATVPVSYLAGTPLLSIYLRLMGAKVGRNVFVQSDSFAIYDLLSIGDNSSINAEATVLGYSVARGLFKVGKVTIGKECLVGTRASLGENSCMADGSVLEDLSLLQAGEAIPPGETWVGSPARCQQDGVRPDSGLDRSDSAAGAPVGRVLCRAVYGVSLLIFPVLVVAALFPGIALMNHLNYIDPYYWYLFLSPLVAVSFIVLLCLEIAGLKWLLLGRVRSGRFRLDSWYYIRKWFVDKTMELSLDVIGPLYASVYLSPWYKLLGAKMGKGAEVSTASFISPDLLAIGAESFIADNVSLGAPRVRDGVVTIGPNEIGQRAFIGNSAMLPPGTVIGNDVLIGCLSVPPRNAADAAQPDSGWLGSPALFLRQRLKASGFGQEVTFNPAVGLRALRAAIEFVRVITPSTGFIILTSLLFSALLLLHDHFSLTQTLLFFPVLYLGCGLTAAGMTIVAKWMLVGRYRPGEKPLWSTFVWRNELINALHEHLAGPFLIGTLSGTPFLSWYLRLLGAHIGRRVYLETTDFSEFDLVRIGDEAALNADCTVQTHLFEDRIMKMSALEIGAGCSVGAGSLVLYDTRMESDSSLGPLSLLMKGEVLPAGSAWAGIPARAK